MNSANQNDITVAVINPSSPASAATHLLHFQSNVLIFSMTSKYPKINPPKAFHKELRELRLSIFSVCSVSSLHANIGTSACCALFPRHCLPDCIWNPTLVNNTVSSQCWVRQEHKLPLTSVRWIWLYLTDTGLSILWSFSFVWSAYLKTTNQVIGNEYHHLLSPPLLSILINYSILPYIIWYIYNFILCCSFLFDDRNCSVVFALKCPLSGQHLVWKHHIRREV